MSRKTTITIDSDNPADSRLVTAALNIFFRKIGVWAQIKSERESDLITLAADEWTLTAALRELYTPKDGEPQLGAMVLLVDQPPSYIPMDVVQRVQTTERKIGDAPVLTPQQIVEAGRAFEKQYEGRGWKIGWAGKGIEVQVPSIYEGEQVPKEFQGVPVRFEVIGPMM